MFRSDQTIIQWTEININFKRYKLYIYMYVMAGRCIGISMVMSEIL
jgi:hypothetical protein